MFRAQSVSEAKRIEGRHSITKSNKKKKYVKVIIYCRKWGSYPGGRGGTSGAPPDLGGAIANHSLT